MKAATSGLALFGQGVMSDLVPLRSGAERDTIPDPTLIAVAYPAIE
jgi:hypothetical protein